MRSSVQSLLFLQQEFWAKGTPRELYVTVMYFGWTLGEIKLKYSSSESVLLSANADVIYQLLSISFLLDCYLVVVYLSTTLAGWSASSNLHCAIYGLAIKILTTLLSCTAFSMRYFIFRPNFIPRARKKLFIRYSQPACSHDSLCNIRYVVYH